MPQDRETSPEIEATEEGKIGMRWGLRSIDFSGGETVPVEFGSMLIIVGPNSSGKSRALREINSLLIPQVAFGVPQPNGTLVVGGISHHSEGDDPELLRQWLVRQSGQRHKQPSAVMSDKELTEAWDSYFNTEDSFIPFPQFYKYLSTSGRFDIGGPTASVNRNSPSPTGPIQLLQLDDEIMKQVSQYVRAAFGKDIVINEGSGVNVHFHIGDAPEMHPGESILSLTYLERLNLLPLLQDEGDGIRSYVGILLSLIPYEPLLLILDEPEAFLHPRQAQRLASLLANYAKEHNRQIVVATHSSAILRGAFGASDKVSVCRITREGDTNHAHLLTSEKLKELWSKPLLQAASAVEGVFYAGVVVCEADADARFYEALVRKLEANKEFSKPAEMYFVGSGGKGELATIASAYKGLHVPVCVVADLDMLKDTGEFSKLIKVLDGNYELVRVLHHSVLEGLNSLGSVIPMEDFLNGARKLIDKIEKSNSVSTNDREKMSEYMADAASWSRAKRTGIAGLRSKSRRDADELLGYCAKLGLFLVSKGELESWYPEGSTAKIQWYYDAMEALHAEESVTPSTFADAYDFVRKITQYLEPDLLRV